MLSFFLILIGILIGVALTLLFSNNSIIQQNLKSEQICKERCELGNMNYSRFFNDVLNGFRLEECVCKINYETVIK